MARKPTTTQSTIEQTPLGGYHIYLPIKTVSEANQREHWAVKARRTKQFRALGKAHVPNECGQWTHIGVKLVRIAPRRLDDDNLVGSFKAIRDGITDGLGFASDSDPRLHWSYEQGVGAPKEYAVEIFISH